MSLIKPKDKCCEAIQMSWALGKWLVFKEIYFLTFDRLENVFINIHYSQWNGQWK